MMNDPEDRREFHGSPRRRESDGRRIRLSTALVAIAATAVTTLAAAYIFGVTAGGSAPEEPPLLQPQGVAKTAPEDPGGMEIRHQDKTVYDRIAHSDAGVADGEDRNVERLLPTRESDDAMRAEDDDADAAPADEGGYNAALAAPVAGDAKTADDRTPRSVDTATTAQSSPAARPNAAPPVAATSPTVPIVKTAATGSWQIQLGAWGSRAPAERTWRDKIKAHPELLNGLTPAITETATSGGGKLYRLRAGPLPDSDRARALCDSLKKRGTDCAPVAPTAARPAAARQAPVPSPTPVTPQRAATPTASAPAATAARPAAPRLQQSTVEGWQIQLGVWNSPAEAQRVWLEKRNAYPGILAGLIPTISETSTADRGNVYRLRAGPLPNSGRAETLCTALKQRNTACVAVAPGR